MPLPYKDIDAEKTVQTNPTENQPTSKMDSGDAVQDVHHVSVRLPPCWKDNIPLWFVQAESQFANSRIKDDFTKYNIIVAALDAQMLQSVSDIVTNPPTSNKYDTLKNALVDRLQDSAEKRLTRLLTGIQLDDRKPTELLRHMMQLAGPTLAESAIVRTLWLQRLPQNVQAILSALADNNVQQLASAADKIIDVYQTSECSAVQHSNEPSTSGSQNMETSVLLQLQKQISALTREVSQLKLQQNNQYPNFRGRRNQSPRRNYGQQNFTRRPRSRSRDKSPNRPQAGYCSFHRRFGEKAYRCYQPCSFKKENPENDNGISQ